MQKITPFLWFDSNAEEAINFYCSVFKNASIASISRYGEGMGVPAGMLMTGTFTIGDQSFMVLNGGPLFKFTEAISFFVDCADQAEVDYFWDAMIKNGGEESRCGWLKDKYGLSWQIIPSALGRLLGDPNPAKAGSVMQAMMQMGKIEVQKLQDAYDRA